MDYYSGRNVQNRNEGKAFRFVMVVFLAIIVVAVLGAVVMVTPM
jgi:nitrate reductase NapE component